MNPYDFEKHLRGLRPAFPSAKVGRVIEVELTSLSAPTETSGVLPVPDDSGVHRVMGGLCWAVGGAAAAILIMASMEEVENRRAATKAPLAAAVAGEADYFEQTGTDRELLSAETSGVVYDYEEQPSQVVSYSSLERYTWANPKTGARLEVEVPRRDVVLTPVSFQ